jgi:hypothetical protein
MPDEQSDFSDSEVLIQAARMLESLAVELRDSAADDHTLFVYKSAYTLNMVAVTLREWASLVGDPSFVARLVASEALLQMVKPGA